MSTKENKDIPGFVKAFLKEGKNKYYVRVDNSFIEDSFNYYGLENQVHGYKEVKEYLLSKKKKSIKQEDEFLYNGASILYGLIHARFIVTEEGLKKMKRKYKKQEFGICPRYYCNKAALLPFSPSDKLNESTIQLVCPLCKHVYRPPQEYATIDGAHFGSSFASLFMMTFPKYVNSVKPIEGKYSPIIYGFKLYNGEINEPPKDFFIRKSFMKRIK
ncbi:casein kinase II regulatory subunit family protein [Entamoeba histolytica HM-1:IMSS-B]|uniref:Casein kinase II subunit beta n=4 Tax=Entamoeba histolytica TaxID=5759 RepID=C4M4Z2_ENTH1|nr:casein kinase II regulatory subunit family protein [Entamoeba histolytica HM-1:IMSS]EAL50781.1 casein kinase II regulatory subunit family protein [Entamoeba histolytica HM-1:IMSS]EMH73127.1 casein kinase II regulatory subunit family protein [Entamoeba histolytica HM-1:IMSS-B]ENY65269.1 casein kinase II regulatory subunit family protein, putative [Entamoeba histolytica HM-1:IMSS-A]GAT96473.1 casein kinase II regulatory subunit family protein [Entamoeba histolytica]|eukprot:XP_656167.1 casein kinase II regulatory subunit family protein [Entamoeba histolytica HM-1:IMSS]